MKPHKISPSAHDKRIANSLCYSHSLYSQKELRSQARVFVRAMPKYTDLLLSGSSSACILAAAASILFKGTSPTLNHIHIYPNKAQNHRHHVKTYSGRFDNYKNVVFLDDLLDTGATANAVIKGYLRLCKEYDCKPLLTLDIIFAQNACGNDPALIFQELIEQNPKTQIGVHFINEGRSYNFN